MSFLQRWDIFCAVVDNYGDIGVCWRLARQLAAEHGLHVRLWVDDQGALRQISPELDVSRAEQHVCGVEVRQWNLSFPTVEPANVVIEAFGCELPVSYVEAMAALSRQPVWVNLEYLSAESWVEGCHGLPSPHPRLPLTKYFFFPGFSAGTGGLLAERDLLSRRRAFRKDPEVTRKFWQSIGLPPPEAGESRISLFGYENAAVPGLLDAWANESAPVTCLVPEGRLVGDVAGFFGCGKAAAGDLFQRGALTVRIMPFLEQARYDYLLWACDCNFVRGEDSFVRAQWMERPFIWQAYRQSEATHFEKLAAFLNCYLPQMSDQAAQAVRSLYHAWNGNGEWRPGLWTDFMLHRTAIAQHNRQWAEMLSSHGNLAENLAKFCQSKL